MCFRISNKKDEMWGPNSKNSTSKAHKTFTFFPMCFRISNKKDEIWGPQHGDKPPKHKKKLEPHSH
jgi:hypothetical protein